MRVRMLVTHSGSPDGIRIEEYLAGQKYDLPTRLAEIFLGAGWAEEDKAMEGPAEIKSTPAHVHTLEGEPMDFNLPPATKPKKTKSGKKK